MRIIRLVEEYLLDFQKLYTEFFRELRDKQGWKSDEEEVYRKEAESYFKRGDVIFLAYKDEPAGFIRLSSREACFWIEEIYVRPKFRREGIGRAFVERAEIEIREHDSVLYLHVLPQDKGAIVFWKKLGYDVINTLELAKNLNPLEHMDFHFIELLGESFRIFRWEEERFTKEEKRFMRLLDEFYQRGGRKEMFLNIVNETLEKWLADIDEYEKALERKRVQTSVTPIELWIYLNARTYENEIYTPGEILSNDYLMLHEVSEIECLKAKNLEITPSVIIENSEETYDCHLEAMEKELQFALKKGDRAWITKRLGNLKSYLEDENLPKRLRKRVLNLINRFRKY